MVVARAGGGDRPVLGVPDHLIDRALKLAQAVKMAVAEYSGWSKRRGGARMAQWVYRRPAPEKSPYKEDSDKEAGDPVVDGDIIG